MKFLPLKLSVRIFAVLVAGLLFNACDNDDPKPIQALIKINIDPGYFPGQADTWVFLSDANGNTIDVRNATDSTEINFVGVKQNSYTFTIFHRFQISNSIDGSLDDSFSFQSYQEIAAGETIELRLPKGANPIVQPDVIGTAQFTLQGYSDSSTPEYSLMITDGISLPYSTIDFTSLAYNGTNFATRLNLRQNTSRILAVTYHNNLPVYKWLENVKPLDAITTDFNSFLPCKTIPINKEVMAGSVKTMSGSNFATSYIFSELYARKISKTSDLNLLPKLGYLDGFEKYLTSVIRNEYTEPSNIEYSKAGAVPESINLPDFQYSISNDKLYGLAAQFSNEYDYKYAYFTQSGQTEPWINWTLHTGNKEEFRTPNIPAEIKKVYPNLRTDHVKLEFIIYYHWLDGYTYAENRKANLAYNRRDVYEQFRYITSP